MVAFVLCYVMLLILCSCTEIRTPMAGVMGSLGLLGETKMSVEQAEAVRIGKVCCEQLLAVINDILDFT